MKKIILLSALLFTIVMSAQRTISDTLIGAETVVFETMQGASQIQASCVELGGTSDGKLILKGSVDGVTFTELNEKAGIIGFFPTDTLAVSSGATWLVYLKQSPFNYYSVVGTGTASDTTIVNIKWSK